MKKLRYNKNFIGIITVVSICILVSMGVVVSTVISKIQYKILVADMKTIEATVTEIDRENTRHGPDIQEIHITYKVNNKIYNRELKTDTTVSFTAGIGTNYLVGDKLVIFYNPQDPNIIATPLSNKGSSHYLIICLIVLCLLVPSLINLIKRKSKFLVTQEEYEKR